LVGIAKSNETQRMYKNDSVKGANIKKQLRDKDFHKYDSFTLLYEYKQVSANELQQNQTRNNDPVVRL